MDIDSIKASYPLVLALLNQAGKNASREYDTFLEQHGELVADEKTEKTYRLMGQASLQARQKSHTVKKALLAKELISRGSLISLVSQYDSFLGCLLRAIYGVKPEILSSSERALTYAQLLAFKDINSARESLIEKEIDLVIRKSHADQIKWISEKIGASIDPRSELWKSFVEITERRNLFVHCDGVVSSQYIEVCDRYGANSENLSVGTKVSISKAYFDSAIRTLLEMGICLAQTCWRKLKAADLEFADESLNGQCLELLSNSEFKLASDLLNYACCTLKKWSGDQYRRIFIINRAQAYKWLGDEDKCQTILNSEDWTSSSTRFCICLETLRDNFDQAVKLMASLKEDPLLNSEAYRNWPIFRKLREHEPFKQEFQKIFQEPFDIAELSSSQGEPPKSPEAEEQTPEKMGDII